MPPTTVALTRSSDQTSRLVDGFLEVGGVEWIAAISHCIRAVLAPGLDRAGYERSQHARGIQLNAS